ncbi:MAG: dihydrofolate reductase [Candidatus Micrarchaeota archaeon]|nr:dihydrofolate reductase [Candidatus Micrarchaeota archaeon]
MRKVYLFMMLSLDGYFEGPNHDISWHKVDEEFNSFAAGQLRKADLFIYGRRTYRLMEEYWPKAADDPNMSKDNTEIANMINNTKKLVISRTLASVKESGNWKNVELAREFDPDEIRRLKEMPGKEIWVGGSNLAVSFVENGLIDEFRFIVNPVFIGKGTPLFQGLNAKLDLELIETRKFKSGNVLLTYRPAKGR